MTLPLSLRLLAEDADDLSVISAALQDAVTRIGDIQWEPRRGRLTLAFNRFRWEAADDRGERVRAALQLAGVLKLKSRNLRRDAPDAVLELLALTFEGVEAPAGLVTLTPAERAMLDQLVTGEVALARRENLADLGGSFAGRRSETERKSAGLDRLTPAELAKLNELVAAAVAARPKPKERPRLKENDVVTPSRAEIHGSMSLTYGRSRGGRDFRAASLWLDYYDPQSGLGLSVGLASANGAGLYDYYPGYYGSRGYNLAQGFFESPLGGGLRDDFPYGEGQSFRGPRGGGSFEHEFRRH